MSDQMNLQLIFDLVDQSSKELVDINRNLEKLKKNIDKTKAAEDSLQKTTSKMGGVFKKQFNILNTPLGKIASFGAIAGILGKGAKSALEFGEGMAEVSTLTDMSAKQFTDSFTPVVENIQTTFGKDSQDVIKALYDGISAGVSPTKDAAAQFLKATAQMSVGGRASMQEAGDLITTVTNAWESSGITFEQAANAMFGTVRAGKVTISQLAQNIGQVATIANTAGVSVQETGAAIAAMTSVGTRVPETMTGIKGILKNLIGPTEGVSKAFEKLGIKSIGGMMASFKENKLVNTLGEIDKRLRKTTRTQADYQAGLKKLFPDFEGYNAVLSLLGNANDKFNESLKLTATNAGQAGEAVNKMKTDSLELKKAHQELVVALKNIGNVMVPYLAESAKFISNIFSNIKMIVDNAGHIEALNIEERSKDFTDKNIEQQAEEFANEVRNSMDFMDRPFSNAQYEREKSFQKTILEVRVSSEGMREADKKTSGQIASEILPELKKYIDAEKRETKRRQLSPVRQ